MLLFFFLIHIAANSYTLPSTMNRTVESNHLQRPIYSMVGRSKAGGFSEDLQKVGLNW